MQIYCFFIKLRTKYVIFAQKTPYFSRYGQFFDALVEFYNAFMSFLVQKCQKLRVRRR